MRPLFISEQRQIWTNPFPERAPLGRCSRTNYQGKPSAILGISLGQYLRVKTIITYESHGFPNQTWLSQGIQSPIIVVIHGARIRKGAAPSSLQMKWACNSQKKRLWSFQGWIGIRHVKYWSSCLTVHLWPLSVHSLDPLRLLDFWISWPGSSEELSVDLIFNRKNGVRVPSEMLISKSTEFPAGSGNIAQMLIY
jgi:hypothetical protein